MIRIKLEYHDRFEKRPDKFIVKYKKGWFITIYWLWWILKIWNK